MWINGDATTFFGIYSYIWPLLTMIRVLQIDSVFPVEGWLGFQACFKGRNDILPKHVLFPETLWYIISFTLCFFSTLHFFRLPGQVFACPTNRKHTKKLQQPQHYARSRISKISQPDTKFSFRDFLSKYFRSIRKIIFESLAKPIPPHPMCRMKLITLLALNLSFDSPFSAS